MESKAKFVTESGPIIKEREGGGTLIFYVHIENPHPVALISDGSPLACLLPYRLKILMSTERN